MEESHPYILARAVTDSRNKVWKKHIHLFLPGPSLIQETKYGRSTSIHSCQGLHCFQEQSMEEAHPYILARAFTVSRNKVWRKHIHTFLPGPSLFPGTKYGGSTSIHSCQGLHCFQEQSMEEAHPYILARAFTVSRNKVWRKHIHTFLPGPSLFPGTKYGGSTSIHSCQGLHCFQEQSMEEAHPYILARTYTVSMSKEWRKHIHTFFRVFTVSRNKVWRKHIHTFLSGSSLFPGTKYGGSTSIHSCQGLHYFQ